MIGGWWPATVPAVPCRDCPPQPDGSPTPWWFLFGAGVVLVLGALVLLLRTGPNQAADTEPGAASDDPAGKNTTTAKAAGGLAFTGVLCAAVGLYAALSTLSQIHTNEKQLRADASLFAELAVGGPSVCREAADTFQPPDPAAAAKCDPSPRSYAEQASINTVGTLGMKFVFSPDFTADGEVTVYDKLNHRMLCVRLPDTDVVGARDSQTLPDAGPDVSDADVAAYISSGGCPDAPVVTS